MAEVCLTSGENCGEEVMDMDKDLERMTEDVENISVQLTWMAYDMVIQRTSPDLTDSVRRLEEEYLRCKAAICGVPLDQKHQNPGQQLDIGQGQGQQPGLETEPPPPASPLTRDLISTE